MPGSMPIHWQVCPDAAALAAAASAQVLAAARAAIAARAAFHLVLSGGRTPLDVYARLATAEAAWPQWHIYFGDERCLPVGDTGRNDSAARRAWLDRVPIPAANVHPIPAELGPERAAAAYAETLRAVPMFDLVLLGLGEDGHTASLFPGRAWGETGDGPEVLAVRDAPKPPAERVTLGAARLSRAHQVLFLVAGAGKRDAVAAWKAGANIPARAIGGDVQVMLDAAADPACR